MKNFILCCILIFGCCVIVSCYYVTDPFTEPVIIVTWDYPVRPGTPEWAELTCAERVAACQIPDDILGKLTTGQLLQLWMDYPFQLNIFAFNFYQDGFDCQSSSFNGLQELLQRNDVGKEAVIAYKAMDPLNIEEDWSNSQKYAYSLNFALLELFISQKPVLDNLLANEKKELTAISLEYLEKKRIFSEGLYPGIWGETGILLIGRILENVKYQAYIDLINQNQDVKNAFEKGPVWSVSENILVEIEHLAYTYLRTLKRLIIGGTYEFQNTLVESLIITTFVNTGDVVVSRSA